MNKKPLKIVARKFVLDMEKRLASNGSCLNMHSKQYIAANLACQQSGQLFIHVCLLRIDFIQRKLTGRMKQHSYG